MRKKIITVVICSLIALNTGVISAFANGVGGDAQSLTGHNASDISTSTGSSGTKTQAGNGKVDVDMNGKSTNPSKSKNPGEKTNSKDTSKTPKQNNTPTSEGKSGSSVGSSSTTATTEAAPEWQISEGWVWSLTEWGNRNDWFTDNKDGSFVDRVKTIFWGDKAPVDPVTPENKVTYQTTETSRVTDTSIRRNRRLVRYDWTITNKTDSKVPTETATSPSLSLRWTAKYTGKYYVIAKPWCRWDVGYETTHTVTITGSDGTVSTSTYTVFHKTGEVEEYYTPGIKEFNFTIGLKDLGIPTNLPPANQVEVEAIDELVE